MICGERAVGPWPTHFYDVSIADVFVSYSRQDTSFVRELVDCLTQRGKEVWLDTEGIADADVFPDALRQAIESSSGFVFVISPDSAASAYCGQEVELALELNKRIVPVVHRRVPDEALPEGIRVRNWIPFDTGGGFADGLGRVVRALDHDLAHAKEHTRWGLKALEWEQRGRDASLVLRGSELAAAEGWLAGSAGKEPVPTGLQREYVRVAYAAARRRQRLLTGVSVAVAAVSVVLVVVALVSRHQAQQQRTRAVAARSTASSRALAARADTQLDTDPQLSILLAREAIRKARTPEALRAMRDALDAAPVRGTLSAGPASCFPNGSLASFAPHGGAIAESTCGPFVRIVRPSDGTEVRRIPVARPVLAVLYSPDGSKLAVGTDRDVRVLDARTGRVLQTQPTHVALSPAAWSRDGRGLIARTRYHVFVWPRWTGPARRLHTGTVSDAPGENGQNYGAVFLPDGRHVLVSRTGTSADDAVPHPLQVYDAQTGLLGRNVPLPASFGGGGRMAVRPDGNAVAVSVTDPDVQQHRPFGRVEAFSLPGLRRIRTLAHVSDIAVSSLSWSPDARQILVGQSNGQSAVWSAATGTKIVPLNGQTEDIVNAGWGPDGTVATFGFSRHGRLWAPFGVRRPLPNPGSIVGRLAVDGTHLLGVALRSLEVYDLARQRRLPPVRFEGQPGELAPNGRTAVVGSLRHGSLLARLDAGRLVGRTRLTEGPYDVGQAEAVSSGRDPRVALMHVRGSAAPVLAGAGQPPRPLAGTFPKRCRWPAAAFTSDAARLIGGLIGGSSCRTVTIWDTNSRRQLGHFTAGDLLGAVSPSPDGRVVAVALFDGSVTVWSLRTLRPLITLPGHPGGGDLVRFSPDGRWLVTSGKDRHVTIFDTRTWHLLRDISVAAVPVDIAFTADRRSMFLSLGNTIAGYDVCEACGDAAALLKLAGHHLVRELTAVERRTYLAGG